MKRILLYWDICLIKERLDKLSANMEEMNQHKQNNDVSSQLLQQQMYIQQESLRKAPWDNNVMHQQQDMLQNSAANKEHMRWITERQYSLTELVLIVIGLFLAMIVGKYCL